MSNPVAVLISDIHYNLNNLKLADAAMRQAIQKANDLNVPLIVAGDLHDTKASLRGECVKAIMDTFSLVETEAVVLIGNHCKIHERSPEHSLEFLRSMAIIVDRPMGYDIFHMLPYFSDPDACRAALKDIPKGSTVIMHQGLTKAWPGEYSHDKSAIRPEDVADFRVISGHYHRAHDIKCGRPRKGAVGLFSYIGSPYTITFAEATDGPKGFRILYDDGTLELVPTNLRKHIVVEETFEAIVDGAGQSFTQHVRSEDLVWLKIKGASLDLDVIDKVELGIKLGLPSNYKLDLIPTDTPVTKADEVEGMKNEDVFDKLIDDSAEAPTVKYELKALWREIV